MYRRVSRIFANTVNKTVNTFSGVPSPGRSAAWSIVVRRQFPRRARRALPSTKLARQGWDSNVLAQFPP